MKLKALLLGSAAALIAVSGARAADAIVAEPEPVEYVKVCDMYGAGFFYIPGTETCLSIQQAMFVLTSTYNGYDGQRFNNVNGVAGPDGTWRSVNTLSWELPCALQHRCYVTKQIGAHCAHRSVSKVTVTVLSRRSQLGVDRALISIGWPAYLVILTHS